MKKKNPLTYPEAREIRAYIKAASRGGAHKELRGIHKTLKRVAGTTARQLAEEARQEIPVGRNPRRNPLTRSEAMKLMREAFIAYTDAIYFIKEGWKITGVRHFTKANEIHKIIKQYGPKRLSLSRLDKLVKEYDKAYLWRMGSNKNPRRKKKNPLTKEEVKEINWKAEMLGRQIPYMSGEGGSFYGGRRRGMMDVAKKYGPKGNPKRRPKRKLTEYIYGVMWADDYGIKVTETSKKRAARLANQFRAVLKYPPCKVVVVRRIKKA
jgi:hypothetical protein